MKKNILEQQEQLNIRRLPGDKNWEYALINGFWYARKQDLSGKWIYIDMANQQKGSKVKNPDAINKLNSAFPEDAKIRETAISKSQTGTQTTDITKKIQPTQKQVSTKLPTDFSKSIGFIFDDNTYAALSPKAVEISKKIISTLGLGNNVIGNKFNVPGAKKIECRTTSPYQTNILYFIPSDNIKNYKIDSNLLNPNQWCSSDTSKQFKDTVSYQIPYPNYTTGTLTTVSGKVQETDLKSLIKKVLREEVTQNIFLKKEVEVSDNLKYHLDNNIPISENIFRIYSNSYFDLINETRKLYNENLINLNDDDKWLVESDLGKKVKLSDGSIVYLDAPIYENEVDEILSEAKHHGKNVKLNSPFRTPGGPKKFAVYVKTPKGTIKKVTFGDPNLKVRNRNPKAAKSFTARHKCSQKKDRTTAGYWSCHVGRYAKKLGLKSSRTW